MSRLKLIKLEERHLEKLRWWRMQPNVTEYLFTDPIISAEEQREWYRDIVARGDSFHWVLSFASKDIGYATLCDVDHINQRGVLNMFIGEIEYRGIGLGNEIVKLVTKYAFRKLHLHKLCAFVFAENYPAVASYVKNDWKIEGLLTDYIFKGTRFYDVYALSTISKRRTR